MLGRMPERFRGAKETMTAVAVRPHSAAGRSLFGDLLGFDPFRHGGSAGSWGFEISKTEGGYKVELPVPGFRPEQVEVTIEDRVLTIVGKGDKRQFTRTLVLPDEIDGESVNAVVEHGMLALELKLHAKAQPRRIPVTAAS
jgi:HSP20 family molecular chaperone IbpA